MIKVIKHGRFKQCICNNCGCIFTYENEDIKHVDKGTYIVVTFVECPNCTERNMVNPLIGDGGNDQ